MEVLSTDATRLEAGRLLAHPRMIQLVAARRRFFAYAVGRRCPLPELVAADLTSDPRRRCTLRTVPQAGNLTDEAADERIGSAA